MIAITANQAHHVDMGGYAPGSMPFGVTEIFQEGLQIPPVRLFVNHKLDPSLWSLIRQNVRPQTEVKGDLLAQFAANTVGQRRLGELVNKYGVATVMEYLEEMLDYSERRMRAALKLIPEGTYHGEDVIEGDGITDKHYTIRVKIEAKGDEFVADFTDTDDSSLGPLNCRWPSVAACVYYVLKAMLDPELPPNAGAYRPIGIKVRDGSLLSAQYPTAVCNANIITTQRIVDVLLAALADALPDKVAAASSGTMNLLNIGGTDPRSGILYNYIETYAGGQGAMHDADGMDAVQNHMTNTRNAPVESIEVAYPLMVETYGLVTDSEGPGEYRGGVGVRRALKIIDSDVQLTLSSDRGSVAPWGLFGGHDAGTSSCSVVGPDGREKLLPTKVTTRIAAGNLVTTETPGGGGWGEPMHRDVNAVRHDVSEGLVSVDRARHIYGVAIDPKTFEVDEQETAKLRANA